MISILVLYLLGIEISDAHRYRALDARINSRIQVPDPCPFQMPFATAKGRTHI